MTLELITLFRERFNWSGRVSRFLQRHLYTIYVIQAPIIVFVAVALMGLTLEHLLKFGSSGDYGPALFCGSLSGSEDSVRF